MNKQGWITLTPDRFHIGTAVRVTGGRMWVVGEDPRRDWSHLPRNEHGTLAFWWEGEVCNSIRTRKEDMEVWHH